MKNIIKLLLCGMAFLCLLQNNNAQQCTASCIFPTQMEKNEVVVCVSAKDGKFVVSTSRNASLFESVKLRILMAPTSPATPSFVFSVNIFNTAQNSVGNLVAFVTVTQSNTIMPLTLVKGTDYIISASPVTPATAPKKSDIKEGRLQVKTVPKSYEKPDVVWRIETTNNLDPTQLLGFAPQLSMFPAGSPTNTFDVNKGFGHAYVKFSPLNNGKLKKPIIFVDGIDFATFTTNYYDKETNGQFLESDLIRHGDTGWDVFSMGADDSFTPTGTTETFREYPSVFKNLWDKGYDVIFLDFGEGATYIQKNVEVLKALIRKIKSEKDGNYPNAIVGPSMGGQVARIALAEMEKDKEDHCTSLYVSFDSPHQGANIPLGLQAMAWAGSETKFECEQWKKLNYPAARQLLVEHLSTAVKKGRIHISKDKVEPPITVQPLPAGPALLTKNSVVTAQALDMPSDNGLFRDKYVELLKTVGYPKLTSNIAIADGNISGLDQGYKGGDNLMKGFIRYTKPEGWLVTNVPKLSIGWEVESELNITGQMAALQVLALTNAPLAHLGLNALIPNNLHRVFDLDINAVPGSETKIYNHHSCTGLFEDKSHLHLTKGEDHTLFHWAVPSDYDKLLGNKIPCEYTVLKATIWNSKVSSFLKYDSAPGGGRGDLKSIEKLIRDEGTTSSTLPVIESTNQNLLTCFIPSLSALDVNVPLNNTNLSTLDIDNLLKTTSTLSPFEQYIGKLDKKANLRHVEVDEAIKTWVQGRLDEYALNLSSNLSTEYNFGFWRKHITEVVVEKNGILRVNNEGATGYVIGAPEGNTTRPVFETLITGCNSKVTVKPDGKFIIGADNGTKRGIVRIMNKSMVINDGGEITLQKGSIIYVEEGAVLHLKSGTLRVFDISQIVVKQGGKLIIEPATNIVLNNSAMATSSDARIQIEDKSTLQLTGLNTTGYNFGFSGNGHFLFENGHILKLEDNNKPANFVDFRWKGGGKDKRLIKLNSTTLNIPERNVEISNAAVEYNKYSNILMKKGISLKLTNVKAYQLIGNLKKYREAIGFTIKEGQGSISVHNSTFQDLSKGIDVYAEPTTAVKGTGYSTANNYSIHVSTQSNFVNCGIGCSILNNQAGVSFTNNVSCIDNGIGVYVDFNSKIVQFNGCVFEHNELGSMIKNMARGGSLVYSNTKIAKNIHGSVLVGIGL